MSNSVDVTVSVLLETHGLSVSEEERQVLVGDYAVLRASLDALYEVEMLKEEEPQTVFFPEVDRFFRAVPELS